jgi:hypothetical protein
MPHLGLPTLENTIEEPMRYEDLARSTHATPSTVRSYLKNKLGPNTSRRGSNGHLKSSNKRQSTHLSLYASSAPSL